MFFIAYREPIVYNLAVVREIGKQVYINEKLAPPTSLPAIRAAYEDFYHKASDASWWRSLFESGDWKRVALYALEAYGIFTIGEMIGRRWAVASEAGYSTCSVLLFADLVSLRISAARHIVGYKKLDDGESHHH